MTSSILSETVKLKITVSISNTEWLTGLFKSITGLVRSILKLSIELVFCRCTSSKHEILQLCFPSAIPFILLVVSVLFCAFIVDFK